MFHQAWDGEDPPYPDLGSIFGPPEDVSLTDA